MRNYLLALEVILALSAIIEVKGQSTAQVCENGDSSNSIAAELSLEAIHQLNIQFYSIREILTESNQERKIQHDNVLTRLQVVERRTQEQNIHIRRDQNIHEFVNASFEQIQNHGVSIQQIKDHLDNVTASLQAVDRRSQEQIQSIKVFLNDSVQQMKNQLNTAITSLQTDYRRSHDKIERIHEFVQNASLAEMKNQQDTLMTSIEAIDRRSQEQDIYIKQIQSGNESVQEVKNQLDTIMTGLQAVDRRSQEQDISIRIVKNQLDTAMTSLQTVDRRSQEQDIYIKKIESGKLDIALVSDVGEVPVLHPIVNNWIVLMTRFDHSVNFHQSWNEYKNGFGDMRRGEFWLGNEKIHRLTNRFAYALRIEMYINGTWFYAEYSTFSIDSESNKYTLRLSGYSGNAGNSLTSTSLSSDVNLDGMSFSTWDVDNDRWPGGNCALVFEGGWWFNDCQLACFTCSHNNFRWVTLGHLESSSNGILQAARMMIKSK